MQPRDLLAELALMHRRVQALLSCVERLHEKNAGQRQQIEALTESRTYWRHEAAVSEAHRGQRDE